MLNNVTVEISQRELEVLVREAVERQWAPYKVSSVRLEMETAYEGYGPGERAIQRFKCVKVKLEPSDAS